MIPARRLKQVANVTVSNVDKKSVEGERAVRLCNYTDVYYNERITPDLPFMDATATTDQLASFNLRAGDVLITKDSETADDIALPAYVAEDMPGVLCGYHLAILRPLPGTNGRYLYWALTSRSSREQFSASATGVTRFGLRYEAFGDVVVPLPSLQQQRFVADYLDAETARIDALIARNQHMNELLDERFESVVFHAITRGASHERPLKASGLSWIEKIPLGWGTPTVSANFDLQLGKMLNGEAAAGSDQYPYLRNTNLQWDRFDLDNLVSMHFDEADRRRYELRRGDLLVCEGGEVGRAAVWNGEVSNCYFQKAIHRVRPRGNANSRYLMYCLRAAAKRLVFSVEGNLSTIVHLTGEQLRAHRFPWPPAEEQATIVERLDETSGWTIKVKDSLSQQIKLLAEHRQELIAAAVTGELKMPDVAA